MLSRYALPARRAIVLLLLAGLVAVGVSRRARAFLVAKFWHLQHGDEVNLGNYVIAVPPNWIVGKNSGSLLVLRDLRPAQGGKRRFPRTLTILRLFPLESLDGWRAAEEKWLATGRPAKIDYRYYKLNDDETVLCMNREGSPSEERPLGIAGGFFVCRSTGSLEFVYSGEPSGAGILGSMISGIRKRKVEF